MEKAIKILKRYINEYKAQRYSFHEPEGYIDGLEMSVDILKKEVLKCQKP